VPWSHTHNICCSRFHSWVAEAMGVKFLVQGKNSSRRPWPGIEPGILQLPGRCPGSLLLPAFHTRVSYLFSDTMYTRTRVLVHYPTNLHENCRHLNCHALCVRHTHYAWDTRIGLSSHAWFFISRIVIPGKLSSHMINITPQSTFQCSNS